THNPNLAVVCDSDQIVHAEMDKRNKNTITYVTGSLENPNMRQYVTDMLEGTLWAFRVRDKRYCVGEQNCSTSDAIRTDLDRQGEPAEAGAARPDRGPGQVVPRRPQGKRERSLR